jgi:ribosomal protein S18 acetylase RimI-like enzyme
MLAPDVAVAIAEAADGTIVAGAMVVLFTEPEPTGYVSFVACADAARGHGLGDAVTRMVTNEAFARGVTLCTLEASHFGRNTYDRMGYRTLYDYRLLIKV